MALEAGSGRGFGAITGRSGSAPAGWSGGVPPSFAINTGTDGDLSNPDDWHILPACNQHSAPLDSVATVSATDKSRRTKLERTSFLKHGKHPKLQYASFLR